MAAAESVLTFGGGEDDQFINHIVKGQPVQGILKMNIAGMVFKAKTTGVEVKVYKSELMTATWMRVARGNQLTLKVKGGNMVTFDNFRTAQKEQMMEFMKENFEKATVSTEEPSVCGWNWGNTLVHGSYMRMMVKDKCAFEIPLSAIEAAQSASKHEASVQFEIEEGSNAQQLESMRFHFTAPPDDEIEDESRPDQFVKEIMAKIDVTDASESIAKLDDIMCMTPRGKYDFEFFPTHLALHGKTFDFKVLYTSIVRMFLLDKPDQATNFFVLQVDPPLVNNLKKHSIITFSIPVGDEVEVELVKPDVDDIHTRLQGFEDSITGPCAEVVAQLLQALSKAKVYSASSFRSDSGNQAVKSSVKNVHDGYLYPLERSLLFVFKFAVFVRYSHVASISFQRINKSDSLGHSFDLEVVQKDGEILKFTSIPKVELKKLQTFLGSKNLKVISDAGEATALDDEEFDMSGDENDAEDDQYMRRMRAEARQREEEESDEDEDYEMEEASSVDEEFDSAGENASGDDAESVAKKATKRQKRAKKAERAAKKDPNAPKRALSAYMLFANAVRSDITAEDPDLSMTDVSKKIGEQWKALSEEDRKPYDDDAATLKAEYETAKAKYDDENPDAGSTPKKRSGPKKPLSSYMYFSASARKKVVEENPDMAFGAIQQEISRQWGEMGAEDKEEFENQAQKDKERYKQDMIEYKLKKVADGDDSDGGGRKGKKRKDPNEPKRPLNAYMLYSQDVRDNLRKESPSASLGEIAKQIGAKWKELSDEDKTPFEEQAAAAKEAYDIELADYRKKNPGGSQSGGKAKQRKLTKKSSSSSSSKSTGKQTTLSFKSADFISSDDNVESDGNSSDEALA